jgi:serine/threonine protein kinase/Flp pilus assembly protein TadD
MKDAQEQAEKIFENALGLDESMRVAFLDEVCRDTPEIRVKVEQLLAEDALAGSFLKHPLFEPPMLNGGDCTTIPVSDAREPHKVRTPAPEYTPQFKAGDLLLDRFEVVRFIARGGMGEVYEVEDRHLRGVHLAVKTILAQFASDPLMQDRFEHEILHAREVVHPNLCPIYDIFHWKRPQGVLTFLTMKLLPGESLAARLDRLGPRPSEEAACIVTQVAAGIAAAHDAGILHRDIKAANIMVDGLGDQVHACVTDFGLARGALGETTSLTVGGIAGTPGYMAPELFLGNAPTKASDVYAFGVVVYQAFTGHLPKRTSQNGHAKKNETLDATLPAKWSEVVKRCLEPDPGRRVQDVSEALEPVRPDRNPFGQFVAKSLTRRNLIIGGSAWAAAVAGGAWFGWDEILDLLHPLPEKRYVALMAWPAGESQSVVQSILDSIQNRLARAEASAKDLLIISFNDLRNAADTPQTPTSAVAALGANLVLAVSLHTDPSLLTLSMQLLEPVTQKKLRRSIIKCAPDRLSSLAEDASKAALALLGLPQSETPLNDQDELKLVSPETIRAFSDAQQLVNEPNDTGLTAAILKYQQALISNPHFAFGYARLANAYIRLYVLKGDVANLGLGERNASRALGINPNSASGLFSEGLSLLYLGKPDAAIDSFAKAIRIDPGNSEIALNEAWAFRNLGRFKDAEQVFRDIIKERPNYWPAYDALGFVLWRQARYKEAAAAYGAAANAAPNVAQPLANLGALYFELGKRDDAVAALNASLKRGPSNEALIALGDIAFIDGKYTTALDYYQRAADQYPKNHVTWRDIGDCYAVLGRPALVQKNYAKAAEILSDAMAMNPGDGAGWATLAFYHAKIHDTADAEADLVKAKGANEVESQFMMVQAMALLGRKDEAMQLLLKCMDRGLVPLEVDGALDLGDLRKDPRYLSRVQKLRTRDGAKAS